MTQHKPRWRAVHGVLLVDKPQGLSSNQALQRVRRLYRAEKAGHTGSLDPLATGMLPICFGEATKIAGLLLGNRKAYVTVAKLGERTDTDDAEGQVVRSRAVPHLDDAAVEAALAPLRGRIAQVPPMYSALKRGGEALYAKARRGERLELPPREVEVFDLSLVSRAADTLRLHVECGSGTYVRSLVRDLGEALGCGAHVAELRRTWVEPFTTDGAADGCWRMHTLEALERMAEQGESALDALLLPVEAALPQLPRLTLDATDAAALGHGREVPADGLDDGLALAVAADGTALGLVRVDGGRARPERLFRWAAR